MESWRPQHSMFCSSTQQTLAQRLAPAGRGVRVLNRGVHLGAAPPAAHPTGLPPQPRMPHSASEPSLKQLPMPSGALSGLTTCCGTIESLFCAGIGLHYLGMRRGGP